MQVEEVGFQTSTARLSGVLTGPSAEPRSRAGVLVAPGGLGLDDFARERSRRLADLGFVTLAVDYFEHGRESDRLGLGPRMSDPTPLRDLMNAALDVLVSDPRVDSRRLAAVGYCFGGQAVLELARSGADLRGVVGFHPALFTARPQDAANIRATVLVIMGSADEWWTLNDRIIFEEGMTKGDTRWEMQIYGGLGHNFTRPDRPTYEANADRKSWTSMIATLTDAVGAP